LSMVLEINQDQTVISLVSAASADDPSRQANPERAMAILCIFIFYWGLRCPVLIQEQRVRNGGDFKSCRLRSFGSAASTDAGPVRARRPEQKESQGSSFWIEGLHETGAISSSNDFRLGLQKFINLISSWYPTLTSGLSCFQRCCRSSQTNAFAERPAHS
jgi:hypothetical protein